MMPSKKVAMLSAKSLANHIITTIPHHHPSCPLVANLLTTEYLGSIYTVQLEAAVSAIACYRTH